MGELNPQGLVQEALANEDNNLLLAPSWESCTLSSRRGEGWVPEGPQVGPHGWLAMWCD